MNCLRCRTEIKTLDVDYGNLICGVCGADYLIVESVPIMVNEQTDFYKYNRKFKRLVDLKNEQIKNKL